MKKTMFYLIAPLLGIVGGCSDANDLQSIQEDKSPTCETTKNGRISQTEAIEIAAQVLDFPKTRSMDVQDLNIHYILKTINTRTSSSLPDTVAYIINYPENGGFAVVAGDKRVNPILAFSETGSFDFGNETVQQNFISKLEYYIAQKNETEIYDINQDFLSGCYVEPPCVKFALGQRAPWNKYIEEDNPGCAVGCVAVATALIMGNACRTLDYHDENYDMEAIMDALNTEWQSVIYSDNQSTNNTSSYNSTQSMSYDTAVDKMAKLLYWIGKDVKMQYGINVSLAFSSSSYNLCNSLDLTSSGWCNFDFREVSKLLINNHIVYIDGRGANGETGHAWAATGCMYCVDPNKGELLDSYIYCDWGWDGLSNGYYNGKVFETYYADYIPTKYYAAQKPSIWIIAPKF